MNANAVILRGIARRSAGASFMLLALVCWMAGCKAAPLIPPASETPAYEQLIATHNARVAMLGSIYANGVIEMKRKGRVLPDQGNMELWIQQPHNTALRVEKLGEVLLWVGSDQERYWVYDRTGSERIMTIGRHDSPAALDESGLTVNPLMLLDLMGITTLTANDDGNVTFSTEHKAWMVQAQSAARGNPLRVYFDRRTQLPVRIESLDQSADGRVLAFATLDRYESVHLPNVSPASFPRMAERADISGAAGETVSGEVKIAIDQASGTIDPEQARRIFDVNRLRQALRPDRVDEN